MQITLGGVRGTGVVTNPVFREFGGDTTAYLIEGRGGETVLIDFGSGLNTFSDRLAASDRPLLALMTHYHLDHMTGFPVFPKIYSPGAGLRIIGPTVKGKDVKAVFSEMLSAAFWPQQIDMLKGTLQFEALPASGEEALISYGGLEIRWCPVHHPGGSVAYRLDEPATGHSLLVATDIEWALSTADEREVFLSLCAAPHPVDWLAFDGHFSPGEYEAHTNWGHSTWAQAVDVAEATRAGKLVIIHHAPGHDDNVLRGMEQDMQERLPSASFGRQGEQYEGTERVKA